jgi:hypothetical protein
MSNAWGHRDEWKCFGRNFLVTVKRHPEPVRDDDFRGPNRWCVYAYVYPKHPLFAEFKGNDMWQDAANAMPLHGGPSLLRWHRDDEGAPMSVQVGADYDHLHDERFTHCATQDDAAEVFADADELFEYLKTRDVPEKAIAQTEASE